MCQRRCSRDTRRSCARGRRGATSRRGSRSSSRARVASSCRRGWPFGIDVSQTISPSKPVSSAIELGELADRRLDAGAEVHRLRRRRSARRRAAGPRRSRRRRGTRGSASRRPRGRPRPVALDHLPDQRRDHVRRLEVEVVARAVEVRRQQEDRVEAVLLAVGLRADEHRLLRDAVRRVRLLRVAVPEVVLVERHRRELRVGADRPGDDELADAGSRRSSSTCAPIIRFAYQ